MCRGVPLVPAHDYHLPRMLQEVLPDGGTNGARAAEQKQF